MIGLVTQMFCSESEDILDTIIRNLIPLERGYQNTEQYYIDGRFNTSEYDSHYPCNIEWAYNMFSPTSPKVTILEVYNEGG